MCWVITKVLLTFTGIFHILGRLHSTVFDVAQSFPQRLEVCFELGLQLLEGGFIHGIRKILGLLLLLLSGSPLDRVYMAPALCKCWLHSNFAKRKQFYNIFQLQKIMHQRPQGPPERPNCGQISRWDLGLEAIIH